MGGGRKKGWLWVGMATPFHVPGVCTKYIYMHCGGGGGTVVMVVVVVVYIYEWGGES
jgi:hypothetical protein